VNADIVLQELEGMRALARSLVHGDAEADDLLQDAAVAAIEHPPADAPPRAWLAVVLRNRKRMNARAAARRDAREHAFGVIADDVERPDAALDRARAFERLAAALVALEEPFRTTVIRRYLDGETAAQIAKALELPAGTVRWRLKTGLERLRAALDESSPRWQRVLAPLAAVPKKGLLTGALLMKAKHSILLGLVLLLAGGAVLFFVKRGDDAPKPAVATKPTTKPNVAIRKPRAIDATVEAALPPGQGKVVLEDISGPGSVSGRVINWSTGDGVDGADITFTSDGGATTVRSRAGGAFELAPTAPGHFILTTASAPGFLPYAPELSHSNVQVEIVKDRAVKGITVFLFPAVDYNGLVIDDKGRPVAGAKVRLLGTPEGEQAIDKLETEWTSDKDGKFAFHAADNAVFEAVKGNLRGWAMLDGDVALTRQLTIGISNAPARDAKISGRVVDSKQQPIANVLVGANPDDPPGKATVRSTSFATTGADGAFVLDDLDRGAYYLRAKIDGFAPTIVPAVQGGTRDLTITMEQGELLSGTVTDGDGAPIGAYTLLVFRRQGTQLDLQLARSIVDATGRFSIRVVAGEYDLQAHASGWAPSDRVAATAGGAPVKLAVSIGATLSGQVLAADGSGPLQWARILREGRGGGASAQPANAGTVTRADGTFELTGIPPGPLSINVAAGGCHPKIESGLVARDGDKLGPITVTLQKLKEGEKPQLELVGIGVKIRGQKDDVLLIDGVIPGGGAEAAGIVGGDQMFAVDGIEVTKLGLDGAVSKIRGTEGTTVSVTLRREGKLVTLVVTRKKLRA
jgi:RNA polymerase sigma factor (sigma-70 family)